MSADGLSRLQALGLAAGTVLLGAALAVAIAPGLAAVAADTPLLVIAGIAAVGRALWLLYARYGAGIAAFVPPPVEERTTVAIPGVEFDRQVDGIAARRGVDWIDDRQSVEDRLRDLATAVLEGAGIGTNGQTPDEALEQGDWTDDDLAAAYFAAPGETTSDGSFWRQFGGPSQRTRIEHAVARLAERAGVDGLAWDDSAPTDEQSEYARIDEIEDATVPTGRWTGVGAVVAGAVGLAVVSGTPALLVAGAVAAGYTAFARSGERPTPDLAVERTVSDNDPDPGSTVTVTVTVENAGDGAALDLRVIDGVPRSLRVVDGSPRHGTALRPGATATFSYTVAVGRGEHAFQPTLVLARDASGAIERRTTVAADGATTLTARPTPTADLSVPVRSKTTRDIGRIVTDVGGSGIEFHSVREYRHGDPQKRIDWNRLAQGQDLATLQFREERSATVMLLVDTRKPAYVAPDAEAPSAIDRSIAAAGEVFVGLLDSDDRVGLAALSPHDCWVQPGAGQVHWARTRDRLTSDPAFGIEPPELPVYPTIQVKQLRKRLPGTAQVVLFSPLSDDTVVAVARRLEAHDYSVTIVSPDATTATSVGRTVARIERRLRLSRARAAGIRVVDWKGDEPLAAAIMRAERRWSA